MNYLTLENVTKSYGPKILFKNIAVSINRGDKIALVAKNGTGKTTLLRVLSGQEGSEGEQAKILFAKDVRIAFLNQDPTFENFTTPQQALFASPNPALQAVAEYETALHSGDDTRLQNAMMHLEELRAWETEALVQEIMSKLGIDEFINQRITTLSGGQRKRLALACILLEEPDFLILDEPTNHLDLDMIEWLEAYFAARPSYTLFMVTHDRYFLDSVCNTIIEMEKGNVYRFKGNYAYYLEQKILRAEIDGATLDKQKKLLDKERAWMATTAPARTSKSKVRIEDFHDLKEAVTGKRDNETLSMDIKTTWLGSKIVEFHNVSLEIGGKKLLTDFSYKFKRGERIGIVGKNGVGKSTFLKMLVGEMQPTGGKIIIGETINYGYYTQDGMILKEDRRVIEVIQDIAEFIPLEKGQKMTAASLLERFLFSREQQQVYASQLSGGEKRRLYLLTVLMGNPNFLILDEPTNDLDILTLNVLEDFLENTYKGCCIIVTHDRYFMDRIVDHLFIFEGQGIVRDSNGNYTEYREALKQAQREARGKDVVAINKPEQVNNKSGLTDSERKELKKIEREVEKLESRKKEITAQFDNAGNLSATEITKLSKELHTVEAQLEEVEMRWMELSEK